MGKQPKTHRSLPRVLVVAPATTARGGIATVVLLHTKMSLWAEMNCRLLTTFSDGGAVGKLAAAASAYLRAPFAITASDLVHIHVAGQSSLLRKLPIAAVARLFRKPLIVHIHAYSPESIFEQTPQWAVRCVIGGAVRVIALSHSWADEIQTRFPHAQVQVIPNPVEIPSTGSSTPPRKSVILFAGKLEKRKGYDLLLEAAPAILAKHPEVGFWFAGHGELDKAAAKAERLGIRSSVRLLGWTDNKALNELLREVRVFCLPSFNEGVPMAILEAMANGAPVVCTPVGGLPQLIVDGQNGFFCSVGDPKSIAEKITVLLNDPELAGRIAAEGVLTAQRSNGIDLVEEKLRDLWLSLGQHKAVFSGKAISAG
jgi:polysaccharide biosynthesis protein VpsI